MAESFLLSTGRQRKALGRKLALYNKSLKALARRAEIDTRVTFHIARHSFANIALGLCFDVRDLNAACSTVRSERRRFILKI